jgi:hypothetical protein
MEVTYVSAEGEWFPSPDGADRHLPSVPEYL